MTPEQETLFNVMIAQSQDMHDFWHKEIILGQPTRAEQLDRVLAISRGSAFTGRLIVILFGITVTFATGWASIKTLFGVGSIQ